LKVTIRGLDDVNLILATIASREAKNLLSATTLQIAGDLAKEAKTYAPNDPKTPGNYADGFKGKRERGNRNTVAASAIVTDLTRAFIWRFHEYGQGPDGVEYAMFLRSLQKLKPELTATYLRVFGQKLEKRLARLAKKAGK
jgi:hypothetical protein